MISIAGINFVSMLTATKNKLSYNFFSMGAVQAISSLIQLLVIPHVIARIGIDGYGVVAVAQVLMFYLCVFTDYSFNQAATRDVTLHKDDPVTLARIFSNVFSVRLILCGAAFLVLLCLLWLVPVFRAHLFLYVMAFTFVIGHSVLINWFFMGLEKMHYITITTLIARLLFAVLVFTFIRDRTDSYLFLFFLGVGNIVAGIISVFLASRFCQLQWVKPELPAIARALKDGWQIMVSHLANSTCHYANIFILRFFAGDLLVGYYAIAERIFFTIRQVFVVFSQAVYPRICQFVNQGREYAISFLRQVYSRFLLMVIVGCFGLFVFSPQVLYFFMGDDLGNAVFFLRIFCVIAVIVCLNIPGTLLLLAMNQKKVYLKVYLFATILNVLLNVVLANYYLATGTVTAILITELFITIGLTYIVARKQEVRQSLVSDPPDNVGY